MRIIIVPISEISYGEIKKIMQVKHLEPLVVLLLLLSSAMGRRKKED